MGSLRKLLLLARETNDDSLAAQSLLEDLKSVEEVCEGSGMGEEVVTEVVVGDMIEMIEEMSESGKYSKKEVVQYYMRWSRRVHRLFGAKDADDHIVLPLKIQIGLKFALVKVTQM